MRGVVRVVVFVAAREVLDPCQVREKVMKGISA